MNKWNEDWYEEEEMDAIQIWEDLVDNDEATSGEQGFMQGYYEESENKSDEI